MTRSATATVIKPTSFVCEINERRVSGRMALSLTGISTHGARRLIMSTQDYQPHPPCFWLHALGCDHVVLCNVHYTFPPAINSSSTSAHGRPIQRQRLLKDINNGKQAKVSAREDLAGGAWAGLRVLLKTLRETPAMFGPVVLAASILLDCLDTIEAIARNQRDYEYLATELGALSKSLVTTYKRAAPGSDSDCVTDRMQRAIEREAKEIESKTERRTGRRILVANAGEQDLME
ncbi:hypothetical protein RHS01_06812 [Rhizoctonia solani]|uniref:Uncharacterized protein n=1 Tax=Rhizoctonia solani TaxID=456999 RepID=A0A8H7IBD0_9AGAM|nr:hypothetical protein RHS01_06812 [Rhizoctonia solani]